MSESLFGHLAERFSSHPENLATEALCYILVRYPSAATTFTAFLRHAGIEIQSASSFRTQGTGPEGSTPDLVGTDLEGRRIIVAEAKFWAGLTDHQPVTYFNHISPATLGVVLFIAPRIRFTSLWPELIQRCKEASLPVEGVTPESGEILHRRIGSQKILALTSWRAILAVILEALEAEGNQTASADVRQLQGLCDRMDSEAFLPLHSEEMAPSIGRRVAQYCQLVNDVVTKARADGLGEWKNIGGSCGCYGRYLILEEHGCFLQFEPNHWGKLRPTPLWLSVKDKNWKLTPSVSAALAQLESTDPAGVIKEEYEMLVPLDLPLGMEQARVVEALVGQIRKIAELLRAAKPPLVAQA